MLLRNQESLARQTDSDWEQTLLMDTVGRGVPWANCQLAEVAPHLTGEYIWVLDDDDECVLDELVSAVRTIRDRMHAPDVIIVRADHGERHGVLPEDEYWEQAPQVAHIGMSNFIVRREVFRAHAGRFEAERCADHNFISAVWETGCYEWFWLYVIAMRLQHGALFGAGEPVNVA